MSDKNKYPSEDKIVPLVKEFRKPKIIRNGISSECKKIHSLMQEYAQEVLEEVEKDVKENIKSRKAEYNHLLDDRDLEKAYDRWKKIKGLQFSLDIIRKHME